jgi:hypothetical protein
MRHAFTVCETPLPNNQKGYWLIIPDCLVPRLTTTRGVLKWDDLNILPKAMADLRASAVLMRPDTGKTICDGDYHPAVSVGPVDAALWHEAGPFIDMALPGLFPSATNPAWVYRKQGFHGITVQIKLADEAWSPRVTAVPELTPGAYAQLWETVLPVLSRFLDKHRNLIQLLTAATIAVNMKAEQYKVQEALYGTHAVCAEAIKTMVNIHNL